MRCPDCNKFVSFDAETEPEIDASVDDSGTITGSVRIVNCCQECGQELKDATLEIEASVEDEIEKHRREHGMTDDEKLPVGHVKLDLSTDGSRTERTQTHDRHGRSIKRARYAKHYYGAEATFTVECECGATFETTWSDDTPGSAMDELV